MDRKTFILSFVAISGAAVLIGGATYFGLQERQQVQGDRISEEEADQYALALAPSPLPTGPVKISVDKQPFIGKVDAPVEVVEFVDFQCPYCKEFAESIVSNLKKDYINAGKVKFIVKDFPLPGHQNARPAAYAANCVLALTDNTKYFQYHDLLFANQDEWQGANDPQDLFIGYLTGIGVSEKSFKDCYTKKNSLEDINQDTRDGQAVGVNGTPIFFVNGKVFVGVPPTFEDMKKIIEDELTKT